jgi:hypothetical protein
MWKDAEPGGNSFAEKYLTMQWQQYTKTPIQRYSYLIKIVQEVIRHVFCRNFYMRAMSAILLLITKQKATLISFSYIWLQ